MRTFAELFCERHRVARAKFARAIFWRCLHRRALPFAPFIFFLNRRYFEADFDLIANIGWLTSASHLNDELDDFRAHPWNRGFCRSRLKIRISGARLCRLVQTELHQRESSAPLGTIETD